MTVADYDRIKLGLVNFVRRTLGAWIVNRIDFLAAYQCKVISQNGDGSLELVPDDSRLPPYSRVPIRYGVPGVSATVAAGSRVLLEFASADPQKPIATVWEAASVTLLTVTAQTIKLGSSASSQPFVLGTYYSDDMQSLEAALDDMVVAIETLSSAITPLMLPPAVAAAQAAIAQMVVATNEAIGAVDSLSGDVSNTVYGE